MAYENDTLTITEFLSPQSLVHVSQSLTARELVLTGQAKAMFAAMMARGLGHEPAFLFINKFPKVIGYHTAVYEDSNPLYLGMGAGRSWFGGFDKGNGQ